MVAAEKVRITEVARRWCVGPMLLRVPLGSLNLAPARWRKLPACRVAEPTPRKLWLLVRPPVRDFSVCDSASITAKQKNSVFINAVGVSASVLENGREVFGQTVP